MKNINKEMFQIFMGCIVWYLLCFTLPLIVL